MCRVCAVVTMGGALQQQSLGDGFQSHCVNHTETLLLLCLVVLMVFLKKTIFENHVFLAIAHFKLEH